MSYGCENRAVMSVHTLTDFLVWLTGSSIPPWTNRLSCSSARARIAYGTSRAIWNFSCAQLVVVLKQS